MTSYPSTNPFADANRASAVMAEHAPNLHSKPVDASGTGSNKDSHRRRHRRKQSEQKDKSKTEQQDAITAEPASPSQRKAKKKVSLDTIDMLDVTGNFGSGLFHHDGPFDAANPNRNKNKNKAPVGAFNEDQMNTDPVYTDLPSPSHRRHHDVWGVHQNEAYTDYATRHHHQDGTHSADEEEYQWQYGAPESASNEMRPRAKSAGAPQQGQGSSLGRSKSFLSRIRAMRENPDSPPLPDPISDSDASPGYTGGTDYFMNGKGQNVSVRTSEAGVLRSNSLLARMRRQKDREGNPTSPTTPTSPLSAAPFPPFSAPTPPSPYYRSISFDKNKPLPVPTDANPARRRSGPDSPTVVFSSSVPLQSNDDRRWTAEGRVHSNRNSNNSSGSGSDSKRESRSSGNSANGNGSGGQANDLSPPIGPIPTRKRSLLDRMRSVKIGR